MTYRIIVDLHKSDSFKNEKGHLITRENGRIYSIKSNDNIKKSYLLQSHATRVIAHNVKFVVNEGARLAVLSSGKKSPHAFIQCDSFEIPTQGQHDTFTHSKEPLKFVSYNPRTMSTFALSDTERLSESSKLQAIFKAETVYLYENSVLFIN